MLPTRTQAKKLEALHAKYEDITLEETRVLFDELVAKYPDMAHHLAPSASIVQCEPFESGVVKV
ncbi:hypothetical protein ACHHYP_20811 [Achlya hypogyna]|uniref:Uncharacterized protein n=1 Tax=Achlya hypogyna TaxID=1202772 RepID=A0A1V9Y927_ACHHY|nr:hypothetical protein ACHHYP_20811 [Achlya hypogyna]